MPTLRSPALLLAVLRTRIPGGSPLGERGRSAHVHFGSRPSSINAWTSEHPSFKFDRKCNDIECGAGMKIFHLLADRHKLAAFLPLKFRISVSFLGNEVSTFTFRSLR